MFHRSLLWDMWKKKTRSVPMGKHPAGGWMFEENKAQTKKRNKSGGGGWWWKVGGDKNGGNP